MLISIMMTDVDADVDAAVRERERGETRAVRGGCMEGRLHLWIEVIR